MAKPSVAKVLSLASKTRTVVTGDRLGGAPPSGSIRMRLAGGAFWSTMGMGLNRTLEWVAYVLAARILGRAGFGELGLVLSTIAMLEVFSSLGMGVTLTKHIAELRATSPARVGNIIGACLLVALCCTCGLLIVVLVAATPIADGLLNAPRLASTLKVGAVILLFQTLIEIQNGILCGFEEFKVLAKVGCLKGVISLILVDVGALLGGTFGVVVGMAASAAFVFIVMSAVLRRMCKDRGIQIVFRNVRNESSILIRFALPAFLGSALAGPIAWIGSALLVNQRDGYDQMGLYTAATSLRQVVTFAGTALGAVFLPVLASSKSINSHRVARVNVLFPWLMGVAVAVPVMCCPELITLLFGQQFAGDSFKQTTILVMASTCLIMFKQGLARSVIVHDMMWWAFLSNLLWAAAQLIGYYYFIGFGAVGLGLATTVAYAANVFVFLPLYARRGVVPSGTLHSWNSGLVWSIILVLALFSACSTGLAWRLAGLLMCTGPILLLFRRMWRSPTPASVPLGIG